MRKKTIFTVFLFPTSAAETLSSSPAGESFQVHVTLSLQERPHFCAVENLARAERLPLIITYVKRKRAASSAFKGTKPVRPEVFLKRDTNVAKMLDPSWENFWPRIMYFCINTCMEM
jgi:hypothetical protein